MLLQQLHLIPPAGLSVLQSFLHVLLLASATPGQSGRPEIYCNQTPSALLVIALHPPASTTPRSAPSTEQSNDSHKKWLKIHTHGTHSNINTDVINYT